MSEYPITLKVVKCFEKSIDKETIKRAMNIVTDDIISKLEINNVTAPMVIAALEMLSANLKSVMDEGMCFGRMRTSGAQ